MQRRQFSGQSLTVIGGMVLGLWAAPTTVAQAAATSLADLTAGEASQGLKAALERGVVFAVGQLGRPGGFLQNPAVRIPLPGFLNDASGALRMMGMGQRLDELVTAMNRAAEAAVPMARDLLVNTIQSMSVSDAKGVLTGGDTAATDYFARATRSQLFARFLPVAARATENVGAAAQYNQIAGKVSSFGLVKAEDAKLENYIANRALDGLYLMIGEEEKKIRQNPLAAGSDLLRKVFGGLK